MELRQRSHTNRPAGSVGVVQFPVPASRHPSHDLHLRVCARGRAEPGRSKQARVSFLISCGIEGGLLREVQREWNRMSGAGTAEWNHTHETMERPKRLIGLTLTRSPHSPGSLAYSSCLLG